MLAPGDTAGDLKKQNKTGQGVTNPLTSGNTHSHTHITDNWSSMGMEGEEGGTKAMIIVDERQKERHLFNSLCPSL